jgi:hypothetical protein
MSDLLRDFECIGAAEAMVLGVMGRAKVGQSLTIATSQFRSGTYEIEKTIAIVQ